MSKKNQHDIEMFENTGTTSKEVVSDKNREAKSEIWFSHIEDIWNAELKGTQKVFYWTDESQMWDWDNCTVSWLSRDRSMSSMAIRIVVRSLRTVFSEYRKKNVKLRYMRGFDVEGSKIQPPKEEKYKEPLDNRPKRYGQERIRWVVNLDNNRSIWQWKEEGRTIESSKVYEIYKGIIKSLDEPIIPNAKDVFNVVAYDNNKIGKKVVPVIYQPAIDSWKNFVREVHCHTLDNGQKIQVSILFNNEELRKHKIANRLYEWFRSWFYGRIIDVETFHIVLKDNNNNTPEFLDFENIYSGENDIQQDSIHLDRWGVNIKYYFGNLRHPIIFINTSNHAMGEHDTNHELWKWEYIAWQKDGGVEFYEKSREKIDAIFKPIVRFRWP
jgi:hypothetical protein